MPPNRSTPLSVCQLNQQARRSLERDLGEVWVEGELSNVTSPASGHRYFTLKDDSAQVRCALFRARARFVAAPLKDGQQVKVRARVSLFEPRGDYQLIVEAVQAAGVGELLATFERQKKALDAEGVFANARALPHPPRRLLVITSATGAAVHDVLAVLEKRWPLVEVTVVAVPVQGDKAAPAMIAALALLNRQTRLDAQRDAVLLTRGGGSLEDLWAFNSEHLARAIHHSRLPVMSAVGHEADTTLADFAADCRAPTPSAGAEQLVPERAALKADIAAWQRRLGQAITARLERDSQRLDALRARLRHPRERLSHHRRQLDTLNARLRRAMRQQWQTHQARLSGAARELNAVSPLAVLERGYALPRDARRQIIRRAADTTPGQRLTLRLSEGSLSVEVKRRYKQ
ncbi:exodeoxyribonuclease VII large subunit [Halomonas cibimaris]|uniref:Exodeoxyribonuclease 7 large subunit n=1 Tax=Halomonas cibimaris TaxID=657012 RepID=A0ABP7LJ46_9GAMM